MAPPIYRISTLSHGFLAAMAKPDAGDQLAPTMASLAETGVRQIVSLLEPAEAQMLGLDDEEAIAKNHGIDFVSFPIPDWGLPPSLAGFRELTANTYRQITEGISTVVHCRAGVGRSGMVSTGILLQSGLTPEQAFALVSEKRGVKVPDSEEQRHWVIDNAAAIVAE